MNWFTSSWVAQQTDAYKKARLEEDGGCEHVEKDISLGHVLLRENDSYGIVGSFLICEECQKNRLAQQDEEPCVCYDCSLTFPRKETISWKWYDFYAAQGDIPLTICKTCQGKEKHQKRVADDKADYEWENQQSDSQDSGWI